MMNRTEHLLVCLAEECDEVGQRVAKALRFGLDEVERGQPLRNRDRILEELRDLIAVALILHGEGVIDYPLPDRDERLAKLNRIQAFMAIGVREGVLSLDALS